MPRSHALPALLLLLVSLSAETATAADLAALELTGIDGELETNVRAHLTLDSLSAAQRVGLSETRLSYLLRAAPGEVQEGLEPYGYYDAQVIPEVVRDGDRVTVRLAITLGDPVRVRKLAVAVVGAAADDSDVQSRVAAFHPREGELLHHAVYEAGKASIARSLGAHGYFDAQIERHLVEVTRAEHAADIDLAWQSGRRFLLGDVVFEGQQFRKGLLDRLVPWDQGEPFDQAQLLQLQQSLVDTDYFSGISLLPEPDKEIDGRVPVKVTLVPGKRSLYNLGLRYGTDSGAGIHARLERRWINDRGHKMLLDLNLAQFKSDFTAQYKVPAFGWLDGWYAYTASLREEQIEDLTTQTVDVSATRSGRWREWNLLAGMNFKRERYDTFDGSQFGYATLVYPSLWGQWKQADDVNTPRKAHGVTVELRGGVRAIGSDVDFLQLRAEGRFIRGLGDSNRILLRAELGTTLVDDFNGFPPSMRFYAGGDRSIRGYGYKEIGERIGSRVFGGRHLALASAEFEHMFTPVWGGAVFVDAGDAFDSDFKAEVGIGAGLRWRSPVGPVRVDIARGLGDAQSSFRLHITVGPDLW